MLKKNNIILVAIAFVFSLPIYADPLPSWNDGTAKKNILEFVNHVTDKASKNYVEPENRIAVFDNDGTLWVEQPIYTQFIFAIARVKELASSHPEWKNQSPFNAILKDNLKSLATANQQDIKLFLAATHTDITVDAFQNIVKNWINKAKDKRFNKPYNQLIYQPMLEVMNYLRANNFKVYIVTGGGQDFVRAFSQQTYGVSSEEVIGTANKTKYTIKNNKPELIKLGELLILDDKTGKPESINLFIGRKPIIAFGNSDGDRQMLEWTQSNTSPHLMLLVHHDDAQREYAYGAKSKIGTFSASLASEAKQNGWDIISMKNDWKIIFPFEQR